MLLRSPLYPPQSRYVFHLDRSLTRPLDRVNLKICSAAETWSVKSIAWLMVQIWFGNTYLSFGQAESFHPIFGPILMTGFAALSNTLLLTSE